MLVFVNTAQNQGEFGSWRRQHVVLRPVYQSKTWKSINSTTGSINMDQDAATLSKSRGYYELGRNEMHDLSARKQMI